MPPDLLVVTEQFAPAFAPLAPPEAVATRRQQLGLSSSEARLRVAEIDCEFAKLDAAIATADARDQLVPTQETWPRSMAIIGLNVTDQTEHATQLPPDEIVGAGALELIVGFGPSA